MKNFSKFILIILGFFLFLVFIWLRFIRERLPKVLPLLNLTGVGSLILIYIACIYLLIIYFYMKKNSNKNSFITDIIKFLYLPLKTFDKFIKSFSFSKEMNYKFLLFISKKKVWYYNNGLFFFYFFEIFPRIILISVFVFDAYYFHYLSNIYKILLIGILIIIGKYIKYSLKALKEELIEKNSKLVVISMEYEYAIHIVEDTPPEDENEDDFVPDFLPIPLKEFIEFQTNLKLENKENFPYTTLTSYDHFENLRENYGKISDEFRRSIQAKNEVMVEELLEIAYFSGYFEIKSNHENIKKLKILIFLNYFLLWLYIIIISLPYARIDYNMFINILENLKTHIKNESFF